MQYNKHIATNKVNKMQTTLKQAQQIVKQTVRSIAQQLLSHNNACIARDSSEGVVMYATVATTLQVFTQALQQLNATVAPSQLAQLAAATGREDVSVHFTYKQHAMYLCTCYSSNNNTRC